MGVTRIQHNLSAMNSMSNYQGNSKALTNNLEKLSSGYRINSAADDAAGLAISEKMRSQIAGLQKAQDNANDGISLVQTAEGALTEVNSMLTRLKSLATQSANGTYEDGVDRANIQEETDALLAEIDRISESTNFNGIKLLDGSLSGESQVKNVGVTETTATSAIFKTAETVGKGNAVTFIDASDSTQNILTKDDIGSSIDYTVTWKDAAGNEKTTTAKLTFQGKGDGTIGTDSDTVDKNYFTDDQGTKYYLSSGQLDSDSIQKAIKAGLESDEEFTSNFKIELDSDSFKFSSKANGSGAASIVGSEVKDSLKSSSATSKAHDALIKDQIQGAGTASLEQKAYDSMQRIDGKAITAVTQGASAAKIEACTFEIDGKKFLAVDSNFSNDDIKALDPDINVITTSLNGEGKLSDAADIKKVAAEIQKATGRKTEVFSQAPDKTDINADQDIVFTDVKNKLKTHGNDLKLQIGDTPDSYQKVTVKIQDMSSKGLGLTGLDLSNQEGAAKAIDTIRDAVNMVSTQRGQLGAMQNRLEHTLNNLDATEQNITAAESQIRDVDMAKEMTQYSKNNILVQAAQSMLAQANSLPQGVLSLLQ